MRHLSLVLWMIFLATAAMASATAESVIWSFDSNKEGWSGSGGAFFSAEDGSLVVEYDRQAGRDAPQLNSPSSLDLAAENYTHLVMQARYINFPEAASLAASFLFFGRSGHGRSTFMVRTDEEKTAADITETASGAAQWEGKIEQFRISLPENNSVRQLQAANAELHIDFIALTDTPDDLDGDGLPNEKESELGTNPLSSDTDEDGLFDDVEINRFKTDPTKADTDDDGIEDGREVESGSDPLEPEQQNASQ